MSVDSGRGGGGEGESVVMYRQWCLLTAGEGRGCSDVQTVVSVDSGRGGCRPARGEGAGQGAGRCSL